MDELAEIMRRLAAHPGLLKRVESLLNIVENKYDDMELADDVEECVIGEMQGLGHNVLEDWANNQAAKKSKQFEAGKKGRKDIKKN